MATNILSGVGNCIQQPIIGSEYRGIIVKQNDNDGFILLNGAMLSCSISQQADVDIAKYTNMDYLLNSFGQGLVNISISGVQYCSQAIRPSKKDKKDKKDNKAKSIIEFYKANSVSQPGNLNKRITIAVPDCNDKDKYTSYKCCVIGLKRDISNVQRRTLGQQTFVIVLVGVRV